MKNIPIRSIKPAEDNENIFESFKIRTVAEILAGTNMTQDLHRHDFYFILAVKKGAGNHEIDFVPHPVSDDSIFIMRPGQVHRIELKSGSSGYLMEFAKDFFHFKNNGDFFRINGSGNHCKLNGSTSDKLQKILASIHEEYTTQNKGFRDIIQANLLIFFIELLRQRPRGTKESKRNDYAQERLYDFLELLETDIREQKQVSHYADKLNLSQFQLNSITKSLMGKTAAELIDDHILLESKRYLLATSNQVNQIAYHLGYEDVSYFIRFFKKHTGYTPEMFRQNLQ